MDRFFSYNDVAIFPASRRGKYFIFETLLASSRFQPTDDDRHVFLVSTVSTFTTTEADFDKLTAVNGLLVIDSSTSDLQIVFLHGRDDAIKTKLLDAVLASVYVDRLSLSLELTAAMFLDNRRLLVEYGFVDPSYDASNGRVTMTYSRYTPAHVTLSNVDKLVASVTAGRPYTVSVVIPEELVATWSKAVKFDREIGGHLSLTKYTPDGLAVLGLHSDALVTGDKDVVCLSSPKPGEPNRPFSFHIHPDRCSQEYGCYASWPSGRDIANLVQMFLADCDQIAHFVPSPDGVWVVHIGVEFQRLLKMVKRKFGYGYCARTIVDAVAREFDRYDAARTCRAIDPHERRIAKASYRSSTSAYVVRDIVAAVPSLGWLTRSTGGEEFDATGRLVSVDCVEWKRFAVGIPTVVLNFDYVEDAECGLTPFIAPYV